MAGTAPRPQRGERGDQRLAKRGAAADGGERRQRARAPVRGRGWVRPAPGRCARRRPGRWTCPRAPGPGTGRRRPPRRPDGWGPDRCGSSRRHVDRQNHRAARLPPSVSMTDGRASATTPVATPAQRQRGGDGARGCDGRRRGARAISAGSAHRSRARRAPAPTSRPPPPAAEPPRAATATPGSGRSLHPRRRPHATRGQHPRARAGEQQQHQAGAHSPRRRLAAHPLGAMNAPRCE